MDENTSCTMSQCFVCGGLELPDHKLIEAISKGYSTFLKQAEAIADTTLLENKKTVKTGGKLKYNSKCKNNI